jgi:hypothetical protein
MRTSSLLASLLLLVSAPACESGGSEGDGDNESESEGDGERSVGEWIELCETQQAGAGCEAVPPGMRGSETWRCEVVIIVRTSEPDCYSEANDSRCLAVSDATSPAPGYILAEPGSMQTWLIEPPPNTTVYGSGIEPCVLARDGMTWDPDPMCACAGKVTDSPGG